MAGQRAVHTAPTAPQPRRAGRNLPAAIGVGVGLAAVLVATLFTYRVGFVVLVAVVVTVAIWELTRAVRHAGVAPPLVPLVAGGIATCALTWAEGSEALALALPLTCLALVVWRLAGGPHGYLQDVTAGVFVALYVPFLAGFAVLLAAPHDGPSRVIAFIATVVASDVGGYAVGATLGRHRMAPAISPGKSWEGLAGSVLCCTAVGVGLFTVVFDQAAWRGVGFGVAIALTATVGDLGESLLKRDLGIKDMGNLLPGHGGLMDRLDSLLPAAAVSYLLLSVLVP